MEMLLREFIRRTVGDLVTVPASVERDILQLKKDVAALQAGQGLTVEMADQIALNIFKDVLNFITVPIPNASDYAIVGSVPVPTDGTVKNFVGSATVNAKVESTTMRVTCMDGPSVKFTRDFNMDTNPQFLVMDLAVEVGDVLIFSISGAKLSSPLDEGENMFTNLSGSFIIQLPSNIYDATPKK